MEVLLSRSSGARHGLLIERGPLADQYFCVQYHVCVNPVCRCEHIGVHCFFRSEFPFRIPAYRTDYPGPGFAPARDRQPEGTRSEPHCVSLAKAIEDEISEAQWAELRELYFAEKRQQTEQADLDQVEVHFPPEVLQGDGSMVGYYELFPYARPIVATLDAAKWILDDQYCVNPTCRCREVGLSFLQGHTTAAPDDGCNEVEISIRYAYDKREITESLAAKASGPSPQDLFYLMKEAQPHLDAIFAERHALLRRLFRRATAETSPPVLIKKPGRNDPCPCGSGKK